jgi:phosphoglycerol transferase
MIKRPDFGPFKTAATLAALTLSVFFFWAPVWIAGQFGAVGLGEIMHTLMLPLEGLDRDIFFSGFTMLVACPALGGLLTFLMTRGLGGRLEKGLLFLAPAALLGSMAFADRQLAIHQFLWGEIEYGSFIDENYRAPDLDRIVFPEAKKNLIIILVESLEDTFTSGQLGQVLAPDLKELQDRHLSFKRQAQVHGAGWTIAGYTAYLFGLPLKLPLSIMKRDHNDYSRYGTFLPGAVSLLEVFEKNGYDFQVIMGSDSAFGGRRNLFKTHAPGARIFDREQFLAGPHEAGDLSSPWGFGDSFLFREARAIVKSAAERQRPFLTIIQTVDSHIGLDSYENDAEYWRRTDRLSAAFARWLEEQDFYRDSVVLIIGDHLYMGQYCAKVELPPISRRGIFNAFLNTGLQPEHPAPQGRLFSSFDLAPTILEAVGAVLPEGRFGLGVSLFRDIPTLLEEHGYERLNEELQKRSRLYDSFY